MESYNESVLLNTIKTRTLTNVLIKEYKHEQHLKQQITCVLVFVNLFVSGFVIIVIKLTVGKKKTVFI